MSSILKKVRMVSIPDRQSYDQRFRHGRWVPVVRLMLKAAKRGKGVEIRFNPKRDGEEGLRLRNRLAFHFRGTAWRLHMARNRAEKTVICWLTNDAKRVGGGH